MAYKGPWKPKNPRKYVGDSNKIIFRSLWERQAFRWCDENPNVKKWNSEDTVIKYFCPTDKKYHRYHMDLTIQWKDDSITLVEIKPEKETKAPKARRKTKRYLNEVTTFAKNSAKWEAAAKFAKQNGIKFEIWTEHTLRAKGMKIL